MFHFLRKKTQGETVTFNIKGMHCTSCAINIDGALEDTPGVYHAHTSYAHARVNVSFDPSLITPEQLKKIILAEGYEVES